MEVDKSVIVGATLNEIQKKTDRVKLVFENKRTKKIFTVNLTAFCWKPQGLRYKSG
jgi:hypothetical protein